MIAAISDVPLCYWIVLGMGLGFIAMAACLIWAFRTAPLDDSEPEIEEDNR